ncbi:MAG TPA: hypothetical protein VFN49_03720 [Candidatus Aquilonibacter sp.]|nr:hypothetical protein [Candidatus Aquilonibacter sp.]
MRYAIVGHRPGEIFYTPVGVVRTDPTDGGARLTPDQLAYFKHAGNRLQPIDAEPTAPEPQAPVQPPLDEPAKAELETMQAVPGATQVVSAGRKRGGAK